MTANKGGVTIDDMIAALDESSRTVAEPLLATVRDYLRAQVGDQGGVPVVAAAHRLVTVGDAVLRAAVTGARVSGHTWAEIGAAMNTSRQSAFQRFGRSRTELTTADRDAVADAATAVFAALAAGDFDTVRADFDAELTEKLTAEQLTGVWASLTGALGTFEGLGRPFARLAGEHTVVDVPMQFEAGEMVGRLSFDGAGKIAGLFVLRPDALG